MTIKLANFFPGMIGQGHIVGEFNEILTLEKRGAALPLRPRAFVGGAGLGKTRLSQLIGEAREEIHGGGNHRFVEVPAGITRPQLIAMLASDVANRAATVFVDEAHAMRPDVRNMLKPILETGGDCRDVRLSQECIFPADPFKHLWLFASNEDIAAKDPALFGPTGRTSSMHFLPFNSPEKCGLIRLSLTTGANAVKVDADAIAFLEKRVWPNARAITQEMCPEIRQKAILAGGKVTLAFAKAFCAGELHTGVIDKRTVSRFPLGLQWIDIQTLQFLAADTKGKQVSEIGHACGGEPMKSTSYRLQWLASLGLVATLANGRKGMTTQGATYLHTMQTMEKRAATARSKRATATATETPALQG